MTDAIPTREDFTSPNEVIVHHNADVKPDDYGRFQFTAFWLTDQEWVPGGVRGQVFHTSLAEFIARDEKAGRKVRVVTA